jgi:hypothetical protein
VLLRSTVLHRYFVHKKSGFILHHDFTGFAVLDVDRNLAGDICGELFRLIFGFQIHPDRAFNLESVNNLKMKFGHLILLGSNAAICSGPSSRRVPRAAKLSQARKIIWVRL